MSILNNRLKALEAKVNSHGFSPEFGTVEHLIAWLKLSEEKRLRARKPELTKEILDALLDHAPIVINAVYRPEIDEEGNIHYPPDYGKIMGEPFFVGLESCSAALEKAGVTLYGLAELLRPDDGREFIDEYLSVLRPIEAGDLNE